MGRKTKLTKDLIYQAEQLIGAGNYVETVCEYLGIGKSTWYRWMERGEKAKKGLYREFWDAIKRAETKAEMRAVTGIVAAGKKNWQAYAWYLERKFPERWGRRERIDANVTHDGQVKERHEYDITYRIEHYANEYEQIYEELAKRESALKGPDEGDDSGE